MEAGLRYNKHVIDAIKFLSVAFKFKTLYLFGAGASAFYIKPRYDLYELAKQKLRENFIAPMIYDSQTINLSNEEKHRFKIAGCKYTFHEKLDGQILIGDSEEDLYDILLHKNPYILELICALIYSLEKVPLICPEYQIFNLINQNSIIVNLNHDGLAEKFICKKFKKINLHGIITNELRKFIQSNFSDIIEYGYKPSLIKKCYFATMENEYLLLHKQEYIDFINELNKNQFKYIVFIGYSFFRKNDCDIYDVVTHDLIREYLYNNTCNLISYDLNPYFCADILSKTSSPKITCQQINWAALTHSIYQVCGLNLANIFKMNESQLRSLSILYDYYNISSFEEMKDIPRYIKSSKTYFLA